MDAAYFIDIIITEVMFKIKQGPWKGILYHTSKFSKGR